MDGIDNIAEMTEDDGEDIAIYHIFNRGVEKRDVFVDDADRYRFVNGLYLFNDAKPMENTRLNAEARLVGDDERDKFVDILAFVLMPNHFHLLVRPLVKNGLTEFMRKMGTGYTNYFNIRYERVGPLFQGKFKSVLIENENQLSYIPFYIHFNPIELIEKNWKEGQISNAQEVFEYLKNYRWSSLSDYLGQNIYSKMINKNFLEECLDVDFNKCDIVDWLKETDLLGMDEITLED